MENLPRIWLVVVESNLGITSAEAPTIFFAANQSGHFSYNVNKKNIFLFSQDPPNQIFFYFYFWTQCILISHHTKNEMYPRKIRKKWHALIGVRPEKIKHVYFEKLWKSLSKISIYSFFRYNFPKSHGLF